MDYSKICFVVMPFGTKTIKTKKQKSSLFGFIHLKNDYAISMDFDYIYNNIFVPAIQSVKLPEGGFLTAKRTDKDFFSGDISQEMFEYLEYSRLVLTDITGLNPNVFYELGIRHHSRPTGTAIFRLLEAPIPFDINHIKAFPYCYDPQEQIKESIELVKNVLLDTLKYNKLDSPVQVALKSQQNNYVFETLLKDAENALRNNDNSIALELYKKALNIEKNNILLKMRMGIIYKNIGEWEKALEQFTQICYIEPNFYEAHKEKGIAENKLYYRNPSLFQVTGEESLRKAINLNDIDFDVYASLGGILKRKEKYKEALEMYNKSVELSRGNSYPLLNAIKIKAKIEGYLSIDEKTKFYLERSKMYLENQIKNTPPYNTPWSYFDLFETSLFIGQDESSLITYIKQGVNYCSDWWEIKTFMDSFKLIEEVQNKPNCYNEIINFLIKCKENL
ncbi:hypothetical protein [Clostridium sp. YIM B02555]|uniref:tetratricopeptide repeat protein n=1 Tax=Clostridium sp. YIM B02555 TaxID=2911968 RepID=UPI001EEF1721